MNPVGRRVRTPPRRDEGIAPYHHNKRVGMKFKARGFALAAALLAAGLLSTCEAAYPGNPNFRNLAVTYAAQTCTSWETNAVTASLSKTVDWTKGETISPEDILFKRPGTGISADRFKEVVGRRVCRDIEADKTLFWEDLLP